MVRNAALKVAVSDLAPDHLQAFDKALRRVVTADHTKYALAQIIDGVPTCDVYEVYGCGWRDINDRLEPSSDAVEMVHAFVDNFRPDALYIESSLAQAYQDTSISSREFHLRLLEMVAVAFHMTAAILFDNTNSKPYQCPSDDVQRELPTPENNYIASPFPTFLYHSQYNAHDQYPLGVADIVGYWAETQVFGGVVLFDRGESETECRDAFIHPDAYYAIFQLSEIQLSQFIDFALKDTYTNTSSNVLPFRTEKYARRVWPEESMQLHIFRNRYERKLWRPDPWRTVHRRRRLEDHPEIMDLMAELNKKDPVPSSVGGSAPQDSSGSRSESKP